MLPMPGGSYCGQSHLVQQDEVLAGGCIAGVGQEQGPVAVVIQPFQCLYPVQVADDASPGNMVRLDMVS